MRICGIEINFCRGNAKKEKKEKALALKFVSNLSITRHNNGELGETIDVDTTGDTNPKSRFFRALAGNWVNLQDRVMGDIATLPQPATPAYNNAISSQNTRSKTSLEQQHIHIPSIRR